MSKLQFLPKKFRIANFTIIMFFVCMVILMHGTG